MKCNLFARLCVALLITGTAIGQDLQPIPMAMPDHSLAVPASPAPVADAPVIHYDLPPAPLYTNVRYVDKHEAHPLAVPKIIRVNRPRKSPSCDPCDDECVFIQICIPPCGCETVKCRRDGDRLRYDYGKYKVDVRIRRHLIVVDYQD